MDLDIDNGVNLNLMTIKSILLIIFENKPAFPIENKDILIEALGGKDQLFFINEKVGQLSATALAEKSFKNRENIEEPNQVIDAILGESFINIITKAELLNKIKKLKFPISSKDKFSETTKDLIIYGIPIETIATKLDYPISKPDQILNRIKLLDQNLLNANLELINDIEESKQIRGDEEGEPVASTSAGKTILRYSESYLIKEDKPTVCFEIFNRAVTKDFKCLCISRTHPQQLREKYKITSDKLLWLTDSDSKEEETVGPALESLMYNIEEFTEKNHRSLLILDGLEYLISTNDFNPVLKFIRALKDKLSELETIFILPVSPGAIDEKQIKLIERELELINTDEEINLPDLGAETTLESEELSLKQKIKRVIERGKDAYRESDYDHAIKIYEEGLELDPDNTELRFLKKTVFAKLEDLAKGKEGKDVGIEPETKPETKPEPEITSPDKLAEEPPVQSTAFDESTLDDAPIADLPDSADKIEQLEKRLQEKVKVLQDLSGSNKKLPKDACNSCEGLGNCYWCKGSGKCNTCSGTGKDQADKNCEECNGSGSCHSCQGSGKCRWCGGSGKKKS